MEKFIVTTGKTIDLAVAAALKELNLDRDNVSVEVLENAKSGFLGIGASPAKVKVTYEVPDEAAPEAPLTALSSASRSKPKERPEQPASAIISRPGKKIEPEPSKPQRRREEPRQRRTEKAERPEKAEKLVKQEIPVVAAPPQRTYEPAPAGSLQERVEQFLTGLLQHMGSSAVPHAYMIDEETCRADLVGDDVGMLIGRRGDTLDAIQYLTSLVVNKEQQDYVRVKVDTENYRSRRKDTLENLAKNIAFKVRKTRKPVVLEPMNPYERRIIHSALQGNTYVETYSEGNEPYRHVVVVYKGK